MKRADGIIELTEDEVRFLWEMIHKAAMPESLDMQSAGEACLLTLGASKIEDILSE